MSIQDLGSSFTVAGCWPITQEEAGKASPLGRGFRGSLQGGTLEEADLKSSRDGLGPGSLPSGTPLSCSTHPFYFLSDQSFPEEPATPRETFCPPSWPCFAVPKSCAVGERSPIHMHTRLQTHKSTYNTHVLIRIVYT